MDSHFSWVSSLPILFPSPMKDITHFFRDVLRSEVKAGTSLGLRIGSYVKDGRLVPDAIVNEIMKNKLQATPGTIILDGR